MGILHGSTAGTVGKALNAESSRVMTAAGQTVVHPMPGVPVQDSEPELGSWVAEDGVVCWLGTRECPGAPRRTLVLGMDGVPWMFAAPHCGLRCTQKMRAVSQHGAALV